MYKDLNVVDHHVKTGTSVWMLVGQPNTGKTTLFNALTHSDFSTVNYPGSTVDYSVGKLASLYQESSQIVDSPGILSLTPHSQDEEISIASMFEHPEYGTPDVMMVTADATQLSRQIYLSLQLKSAGFPLMMAITMTDMLAKRHLKVDVEKLTLLLGIPCVIVDSRKKIGLQTLVQTASKISRSEKVPIIRPEKPSLEMIKQQYAYAESIEKSVIISEFEQTLHESLATVKPHPDDLTVKLDTYFLHPVFGIFIFVTMMTLFFSSIFWLAAPLMDLVDSGFATLAGLTKDVFPAGILVDFISDGIITGVGSVMVFVPQIMILFLLMTLLEDSGYLARGAMLVDRPLSAIGLNGRSFVPLLSGFACAIPGMMAARTIPNTKERMLTILIMPLMSCSARLPVYALLLSFLVPADQPWIGGLVMTGLYLGSIISGTIISALAHKWMKLGEESSFILELPAYRLPQFSYIFRTTINKTNLYLKKAGLTILVISMVIWALTYFPIYDNELVTDQVGQDDFMQLEQSYASQLGKFIEPIMQPMGFDWRVGVSLISAFAAREVFVSSLALVLKVSGEDEDSLQESILSSMKTSVNAKTGQPLFTVASAIGLMVYFIIAMQCIATLAVSRKETGSWKIPLVQLVAFTGIAYLLGVVVYQGLLWLGIS